MNMTKPQHRLRFSLQELLGWTAVVAVYFGSMEWMSAPPSVAVGGGVCLAFIGALRIKFGPCKWFTRNNVTLRFLVVGGACGLLLGIAELITDFGGPPKSVWRQVLAVINCPVDLGLELWARVFEHGNTEAMMGLAIPAFLVYLVLMGSLLGLATCWAWESRRYIAALFFRKPLSRTLPE